VDYASGCKPFIPHLTPNAPNPGLIKEYTWDFGNGNGITAPDASPVYINSGFYNVTLTTTDTFGCKDTRIKNNFIRVNGPLASFSSTTNQGCKGLTTTFNDNTSTDGVNALVKWHWEFGDGTTQDFTQAPFTHVYDTLGNFDVQMFVQDAAGCIDKSLSS
jgi:PKD repeat protein